jgi:hypothetical protein
MATEDGDDGSRPEGVDSGGGPPEPTASADDRPSPASTGVVLLKYWPTTVVGVLLFLAGTADFLQHLAASTHTFDGFATPVFLITTGTALLMISLGAAYVRARRAA